MMDAVDEPARTRAQPSLLVRGGLAAGFVLLVVACLAMTIMASRARDAEKWVSHTLSVRASVAQLESALASSEAAQRGYLITRSTSFLDSVNETRAGAAHSAQKLVALTADNAGQNARAQEIRDLVDARMKVLVDVIARRQHGDSLAEVAAFSQNRGQTLSTSIRGKLSDVDRTEADLFRARTAAAAGAQNGLLALAITCIAMAIVVCAASMLAGRRYARSLVAANAELKTAIQESARAEAMLRQSQKMEAVGRLTGGVAHDFNNMLAIVIGSLDMVLRRYEGSDRDRRLIENALEGARRGAALTQRLLAFSRQQPLSPKPFDPNKCIAEVSQLLHRALGEGVVVETVLAAGLWRVRADQPQLESAILNLAVNARDAMSEDGKLTVETANAYLDEKYAEAHEEVTPGQYVMIAVTDTGSGMTPEVAARAFDPFFTTKAAGMGTGLGLSQVHGFVKQSGGHVKLYSEPGMGTTVKIYLPRMTGADDTEAERVHQPAPASADKRETILVVEDEQGVREFLVEALDQLGYSVIDAANAADALTVLSGGAQVDALLTDVVMPGMNGRQLAEQAARTRPDLKVLYMTGYTRNAIVHNGVLDAGMRLLTKPFTLTELSEELRRALDEGKPR